MMKGVVVVMMTRKGPWTKAKFKEEGLELHQAAEEDPKCAQQRGEAR
eukprot:gene9166-52860_t